MLSHAENELLIRVGRGTPMGDLLRRFWVPALLHSQIAAPDGAPVRMRILGEDLVAFRDTRGEIGVLDARCPHRGAELYFGRNEERGLRCVYHGWKFDVTGKCVDMPNEPDESRFEEKVRATAYPSREWGGLVWIYMGPPRRRLPELPQLEWTRVAADHKAVIAWLAECNWLQAMEGDLDTSHSMFLHSASDPALKQTSRRFDLMRGAAPRLSARPTDYGVVYAGRYDTVDAGRYNWRVTQWLMPFHTIIANRGWPVTGRAWVPVDDHHTLAFSYRYRPDAALSDPDPERVASLGYGLAWERDYAYGNFRFPDGGIMQAWLPHRTRANDYLLDREMQRTRNYSGIVGVPTQDRAMTEGMGRIVDRTREHLGSSDLAILAVRRRLLDLAEALRNGTEPRAATDGAAYRVRSLDAISSAADFESFLVEQADALTAVV